MIVLRFGVDSLLEPVSVLQVPAALVVVLVGGGGWSWRRWLVLGGDAVGERAVASSPPRWPF